MSSPTGIGLGPRSRVSAWLHHHRQAATDSFGKLLSAPISTLMTAIAIGIALALPTILLLAIDSAERQLSTVDNPPQLTLLLEPATTITEAEKLLSQIERKPGISTVELKPRDDALLEFVEATGLTQLMDSLTNNPLPHTLWVYPAPNVRQAGIEALAQDLEKSSGVAEAVVDSRWLKRLEASLEAGQVTVQSIGVLLALGVIFVLGNTLRLSIEARRDEIIVIKLIGGGDRFARRPFLYSGLWLGALGGLVSCVVVLLIGSSIAPATEGLFELYPTLPLSLGLSLGLSPELAILLSGAGAAIGWLSAFVSVSVHLTKIQPR